MPEETMQFKTELEQLLHLITHSLYSHREVFLRELISNACDAIDKVRFEGLNKRDLLDGESDWKISLRADKEAKTLTISDNGIGMSKDQVIENLGTIAHSGTKAFLEKDKELGEQDNPEHIGQFGDKWGSYSVSAFGRTLKKYCDIFDVENISNTLEKYPEIIDRLKK